MATLSEITGKTLLPSPLLNSEQDQSELVVETYTGTIIIKCRASDALPDSLPYLTQVDLALNDSVPDVIYRIM